MDASELEQLAHTFEYFGRTQAAARSPLYECLALGASRDPDVLALLSPATAAQRRPTLLLAAVHRLLLEDDGRHPLGRHYPTVTSELPGTDDPWPLFRAFCLDHREQLQGLIAAGSTQINEVARCSALMPAIALAQRRFAGEPIALLDVGASAGMHLLVDRFAYRYRGHGQVGDPASRVVIDTDVEGQLGSFVPAELPHIGWRAGIDRDPFDLDDPEQLLWLRAMVWPDADGSMELLDNAVAIARQHPVSVHRGDATRLAEFVAQHVPETIPLVVMHATLLTYLEPNQIAMVGQQLEQVAAARGRLARVALEAGVALQCPGGVPAVTADEVAAHTRFTLALTIWNDGERDDAVLAHAGTYGQVIAWRDRTTSSA